MADRQFTQFQGVLEKGIINLWCTFKVGATGAPTLQQWDPTALAYKAAGALGWHGVKKIVRNSTGNYTITLQDAYQKRVLGMSPTFEAAGTAAAIGANVQSHNLAAAGGGTVVIQFVSSVASAIDPASGEQITINFTLSNSSAL